ncbi:glycosyltransferase [Subsaxibacter sp. CAU 1640]|uniref:glycosyltransferase family 2 protein n=1 Tax=Subsaxibacter sp. CAU 1640 TaxID=2933271 RepID=UPI002003A026|nr:glycosyltransferase family 2 protein [Subsaxibacter sp. CAU 1640]MCK7590219.1 glycosyltransferase [Subsaxibacter sp. CAU 1640]
MKVSIITATYNSAKTLEVCMNSVLNQTYKNIEYVIIDGNSLDGTVDLIKSKAAMHHQIVWSSENDQGIYDALNKGINKSTGDIIGFVHSDDFLANNQIIEDIVNVFQSEQVDGVYGNLHYVRFENVDDVVRNWTSQPYKRKLLNRGWMPAHPTLFLKNEIYKNNGNFNINYRIAADYDFILRIFKVSEYRFYYLPKTITKMRVGGASNKSLKNLILKTKEDFRAAKNNAIGTPILTIGLKNLSKIPQWISK